MNTLKKIAILGTALSVAALYVTGDVVQSLETDGKHLVCIVSWHIPFYRTLQLPEWTWWTFTRIWLATLLIPPILWAGVGINQLASKFRPRST